MRGLIEADPRRPRQSVPGGHHMRCALIRAVSCAIPVQLRGGSDHGLRPELHVSHPCVAIGPPNKVFSEDRRFQTAGPIIRCTLLDALMPVKAGPKGGRRDSHRNPPIDLSDSPPAGRKHGAGRGASRPAD